MIWMGGELPAVQMHNNCAAFWAGMIKVKLMSEAIVLDHIALTLFSPVIAASGISGRSLISG